MAARNALSDDCATTTPGAIASEASATVRKRKRMTRSGDGADAGAATLDAPSHGSRQLITTGPPDYEGCARRYPLSTRYPVPGTQYQVPRTRSCGYSPGPLRSPRIPPT